MVNGSWLTVIDMNIELKWYAEKFLQLKFKFDYDK